MLFVGVAVDFYAGEVDFGFFGLEDELEGVGFAWVDCGIGGGRLVQRKWGFGGAEALDSRPPRSYTEIVTGRSSVKDSRL